MDIEKPLEKMLPPQRVEIVFKDWIQTEQLEILKKEPTLVLYRKISLIMISITVLGTLAGFSMYAWRESYAYLFANGFSLGMAGFGMYGTLTYKVMVMALYGAVLILF